MVWTWWAEGLGVDGSCVKRKKSSRGEIGEPEDEWGAGRWKRKGEGDIKKERKNNFNELCNIAVQGKSFPSGVAHKYFTGSAFSCRC